MRYCFATNPTRIKEVHVPGDPDKLFMSDPSRLYTSCLYNSCWYFVTYEANESRRQRYPNGEIGCSFG
jgi:hypothetical protein